MIDIKPQAGPQEKFLETEADIAIYGGAGGGGKTFGLILDALRHYDNGQASTMCFRRTGPQIKNPGGLWDTSAEVYSYLAEPKESSSEWNFPSGYRIKYSHLEYEKNIYDHQGTAYPVIHFDELTHFTEKMFFYLLSRNRSTSGIKPYVRATCNPDFASWVRKLIDWWIGEDGFPIAERSGVLRWFVRIDGQITWGNSKEELEGKTTDTPKSLTFIPAKLSDNKILEEKDPGYRANLQALDKVERGRLLDGNWNIKASSGMYFKSHYFEVIEDWQLPMDREIIRYWDRASTEEGKAPDPDYTAGIKLSRDRNNVFYIEDMIRLRGSPARVEGTILNTASIDGKEVTVGIEQDPGQSGVFEKDYYVKKLLGFKIYVNKVSKDKETRVKPVSSQAEQNNIKIVSGDWNDAFFTEIEAFPAKEFHDDQVDAFSGAFSYFTNKKSVGTLMNNRKESRGISPSLNSGKQW